MKHKSHKEKKTESPLDANKEVCRKVKVDEDYIFNRATEFRAKLQLNDR